jgi:hypothetical protein
MHIVASFVQAIHEAREYGNHQGHDNMKDGTVFTWLLAAASLACLIPTALAFYRRQLPLASTLVGATLVPVAQLQYVTPGLEATSALPEILGCASYVCSILCIVQLVVLLIGHWNQHLKVPAMAMHAFNLALCALMLAGTWKSRHVWATTTDFERVTFIWIQVLIGAHLVSYWLITGADGRKSAAEVFLHGRFWGRVMSIVALLSGYVVLTGLQEAARLPPDLFPSIVRGTAAIAASLVIWSVRPNEPQAELGPPAAHWLLCGSLVTLMPMLLLTLGGDFWQHQAWRWPTLSMAASSKIGNLVFTAYALPFAATILMATRIIEYVPPDASGVVVAPFMDLKRPTARTCHHVGCQFCRIGVLFGVISSFFAETSKVSTIIHTVFATAMFVSYALLIVLTAVGSNLATRHGKTRWIVACCTICSIVIFGANFLFANNYLFPKWRVPHDLTVAFACSEYTMLILVAAYPMTWIPEVKVWQQRGYTDTSSVPVVSKIKTRLREELHASVARTERPAQ